MASAFLSSIISKTIQVLDFIQGWEVWPSSSSDSCSSVLKDLKKLERTLNRIQAVLHDAEEREILDEAIKLCLKELKEVAYDAEDVLDEFHYEELRAQAEGRASCKRKRVEGDDEEEVSGSLSTMVVSLPDGMGNRIREIRARLDEISGDSFLRLREEDGERRVFEAAYPAPTSHMVDESSIYGRVDDKQEVIDLLLFEGMANGISVIPIVGKGGLGKTTIAQLVYNDSKVEKYFDLIGWVYVSNDFDVSRLTKTIIESITQTKTRHDITGLSPLQKTLEEKMKGKRVLLVLDDVWNEQQSRWESLRKPFVSAEIVRIIVTCRNDSVADIMRTVRPYHLGYLSEDESWSLFKHQAFAGRESEEQSRLADIGKQIVKKCSGLPLAVKSIGSLLRYMTDEDSWKEVLRSDLWEVDKKNEILPALRLSYNRMPAHLKPCFVYCSIFPKDYEFEKDILVRLWMAQGYIPPEGRRRMEDIGDEYFNDLLRRSFFDPFDNRFKMHDMIHELAKSIAGNECCTIVDKWPPGLTNEVRHLYVQGEDELMKSLCSQNLRALRTLLPWNPHRGKICLDYRGGSLAPTWLAEPRDPTLLAEPRQNRISKNKYITLFRGMLQREPTQNPMSKDKYITQFTMLQRTRCLRALQLQFDGDREDELPNSIGNLKQLRYLHIESSRIEKLPKSVCLLYHLQTLIIHCSSLGELPDGLGNLTNLRYFELHTNCIKRLPESVWLLDHLQTLIIYCRDLKDLPDGLGSLTNLRYLKLGTSPIKRLPRTVCQLHSLETLVIQSCLDLEELPCGIESLTNLRHLDLRSTRIYYLPTGIWKLTDIQSFFAYFYVRRGREQGGIGVLKDLVNLQGILYVTGLRNEVNVEDARNANLKYKHKLECLFLDWEHEPSFSGDGLHLDASPEEDKDVPVDEKGDEATLDYLQPHANLKKLYIGRYGGSKFPKWMGNPFSFASLQDISIDGCENVRSLPLYVHDSLGKLGTLKPKELPQSMLEWVYIFGCRQLKSIMGLHNLHLLKVLKISDCPQLLILSEEGLPSKLKKLYIRDCQQLTSLSGIQNLTSLGELTINNCPKLHIMAQDQLSSKPHDVDIVDCPGFVNWCQTQKINCIQVVSGNKLTISNTWENIKDGIDYSTSLEAPHSHLGFSSSWKPLNERIPMIILQELTISSCMHIPAVGRLPRLTSLHSLVIKDCLGVQLLPDELLPSTLKSLVVDSCENLRYLQLVQENRDALQEMQIVNCPMLVMVEGLNSLFFPKFLRIEECPQLSLSQED